LLLLHLRLLLQTLPSSPLLRLLLFTLLFMLLLLPLLQIFHVAAKSVQVFQYLFVLVSFRNLALRT